MSNLPQEPALMGIINMTPDSFSDGGMLRDDPELARQRAREMIADGASIIDIGGESTRPGSAPVPPGEELRRVIPLATALCAELQAGGAARVSVDTSCPRVMEAALTAGVSIINDVRALSADGALQIAAAHPAAEVVLMHGAIPDGGERDLVERVGNFLERRLGACLGAGIAPGRVILDPGFGFGKDAAENFLLLRRLGELCRRFPGQRILVGVSRKRMIGAATGVEEPRGRDPGSHAAAAYALLQGASLVRVHDVRGAAQWLRVLRAIGAAGSPGGGT
ncbi:MAG: dihydropteroate synthase [Succinivibrionaceae bacterium]|nr:dihydropteroate synthase [Succinivibrionaceae bacterium]